MFESGDASRIMVGSSVCVMVVMTSSQRMGPTIRLG